MYQQPSFTQQCTSTVHRLITTPQAPIVCYTHTLVPLLQIGDLWKVAVYWETLLPSIRGINGSILTILVATAPWSRARFQTPIAASQEILRLLCTQKVHYRVHNSQQLVPILGQINPAYTHWFFKIYFSIILTTMCVSPKWPVPFRISGCNFVWSFPLFCAFCMSCPYHSHWFDSSNNIWLSELLMWDMMFSRQRRCQCSGLQRHLDGTLVCTRTGKSTRHYRPEDDHR
jgi:hypothetical protein